jgi:RNA polymerase sigma-70 factor (ECF subfamily)
MLKAAGISTASIALCIPALRAVSTSLANDRRRADDLVEDTIVRLLTDPQPVPPGTSLKVWMLIILHGLHDAGLNREPPAIEPSGDRVADWPAELSNPAVGLPSDDFRRAFRRLSDAEREVLILAEASGMSREEVAAVCGCATSLIDSRVSWARQKLVRALGEADRIELVAPPRGNAEAH